MARAASHITGTAVPEVDLFYPPTTIACARPTFCLFTSDGLITTWDGATFTTYADQIGTLLDLSVTTCLSSTWCIGLDSPAQASVVFRGGTTWDAPVATAAPPGTSDQWTSVDCSSTTDCIAIGSRTPGNTPSAKHWNGTGWTDTTLPIASEAAATRNRRSHVSAAGEKSWPMNWRTGRKSPGFQRNVRVPVPVARPKRPTTAWNCSRPSRR